MPSKDSVAYYKANYQTAIVEKGLQNYTEKSGFCTVRAHIYGCVDTLRFGDFHLTLYLDGLYHVLVTHTEAPQLKWLSFDSRPAAKKAFLMLRKAIKNGASLQDIENIHIEEV